MKTCPICKARCFDDMEICYGCMHRFEEGGLKEERRVEDVTDVDQMPLRPGAMHGARESAQRGKHGGFAAEPVESRRQPGRGGPSRVFGAVDGGDLGEYESVYPEGASWLPAKMSLAESARGTARLEIATGPLASAPIGDGYRLVVSIEHE